ncbi:hypothetical protein H6P81_003362 [Aristolochia fimbriata]|uniref:Aminotransferase-like plant mobile domain-containing protein n=1 Tax=Aristolochia fimbriata TaxID=158543 RepID=A0AAV7FE31_ARIFI|nr:hypothetical protein H6P81_003362 [Aristolochia fimbriata]
MNGHLTCHDGEVLGCKKVQWYSHQLRRGRSVSQCPLVFEILWIGEITVEDICAVNVNNPVITNGLVKHRLLTVQKVLMWGLVVGNLWAWERLHIGRPTLLEGRALQDGPLGSRWNVRRTNATNPCGNLVLYRTELNHQRNYQVNWQLYLDFLQHLPAICVEGRRIWLSTTPLICFEIVELHVPDRVMLQFGLEQVTPPEDVEHVTRISRKGRAGEDWAAYHRDYIARWEARAESVVTGSRAHTPKHAPSEDMTWYLSVTRRFVSPPPIEPTMVYHPRGYTEEALLGCVRNVVERVNCREAMDPLLADPYLMEIGHYCQLVLHSFPLLEVTIVGEEMSHVDEPSHMVEPTRDRAPQGRHARRRPTSETTTRVEDPDEVPVVPEPMMLDLPPEQTPEREPEQPPEPEPSRHPPIRRIYTRRQKKAIGAPEPSSAL